MRKPSRSDLEAMISATEMQNTPTQALAAPIATQRGTATEKLSHAFQGLTSQLEPDVEQAVLSHRDALRQARNESKARAVEQAAQAAERLDQVAASRADVLGDLAPEPEGIAPWDPEGETALFIRSSLGATLRDYNIAPRDTWAKWDGPAEYSQEVKVSFYYLWENTRRRSVLADIAVWLSLNGHIACSADGAGFPGVLFFGSNVVEVDLEARLTLWPLWTPGAQDQVHAVPISGIRARAGILGDSDDAAVTAIAALQSLRFAVAGRSYVMIEASVVAKLRYLSGDVDVDFSSGDAFRIQAPYCLVTVPV